MSEWINNSIDSKQGELFVDNSYESKFFRNVI